MDNKMICIDKQNRPTIYLQSISFSAWATVLPKIVFTVLSIYPEKDFVLAYVTPVVE